MSFIRSSIMAFSAFSCKITQLLNSPQIIHGIPRSSLPTNFCSSVTKLCPTLCNPMDCSMPGFPVLHYLPEFAQTHVHCIGFVIHLILCHPLLLLPSVLPNIRIFSNESALHIRWPKYWRFSFSISPSSEHSGLTSIGLTGLISLKSKGISSVFSNTTLQKHQFFGAQLSL